MSRSDFSTVQCFRWVLGSDDGKLRAGQGTNKTGGCANTIAVTFESEPPVFYLKQFEDHVFHSDNTANIAETARHLVHRRHLSSPFHR